MRTSVVFGCIIYGRDGGATWAIALTSDLAGPKGYASCTVFQCGHYSGTVRTIQGTHHSHRIGVWAARTGEYDARELMQYVSDTSTQVIERALKCHPNWKRW
jgi:hypothetical protein